jgi:hypothetical protein
MHGLIEIFQAKDELGHEHCGYHSLGTHDNWQNLNTQYIDGELVQSSFEQKTDPE